MKITTRLKLIAILSFVIVAVIAGSLWTFSYQDELLTKRSNSALQLIIGVTEIEILTSDYLLFRGIRAREQWLSKHDSMHRIILGYRSSEPVEQQLIEKISKNFLLINQDFTKLTQLQKDIGSTQHSGKRGISAIEERLHSRIILVSRDLATNSFKLAKYIQAAREKLLQKEYYLILILSTILLGGVVFMTMTIRNTVVKPISKLQKETEIIGKGNLDHKIAYYRDDEIGAFSRAFDQMTSDLSLVTASKNDLEREMVERQRAEKELQKSQEKFRFLAENMADIVWTLDREFNPTYVSPSIEKVLGFTPEERNRQTLKEVVTPESLERITTMFLDELQRDEIPGTDSDRSVTLDVEYYHKNGSIVWMENIVKAIRDQTGSIIGMYGSSRNITDRKKAEKALRESEEKFRAIFEQAAVGVALISTHTGKFIQINRKFCDITGYSEDALNTLTFQEITHPDDLQADLDKMQALMEGKINDFSMEKRYLAPDGSTVWVNLTVSSMWKVGDQTAYNIGIIEDITDRKLMEAEVKTLSGLLPICAACKKIRDDKGYWNQIESYIHKHSDAEFSHGICPECKEELYGEELKTLRKSVKNE